MSARSFEVIQFILLGLMVICASFTSEISHYLAVAPDYISYVTKVFGRDFTGKRLYISSVWTIRCAFTVLALSAVMTFVISTMNLGANSFKGAMKGTTLGSFLSLLLGLISCLILINNSPKYLAVWNAGFLALLFALIYQALMLYIAVVYITPPAGSTITEVGGKRFFGRRDDDGDSIPD